MKYWFVSFYFNKQQSDLNRESYIDMMNGNEENCIIKIIRSIEEDWCTTKCIIMDELVSCDDDDDMIDGATCYVNANISNTLII